MTREAAFCATPSMLLSRSDYVLLKCRCVRRSLFVAGVRWRHQILVGDDGVAKRTLQMMSKRPENDSETGTEKLTTDTDNGVENNIDSGGKGQTPSTASSEGTTSLPDDTLPVPTVGGSESGRKRYSMRTRLREETEAPFRKFRMFIYMGCGASAGVGAFISSLRIIAAFIGTKGVQPLSETVPNVAIDLGVVGLSAFMFNLEVRAGEKRLERMSRGARIAKLRLEDVATRQVVLLKDLRGSKRVVIVAGCSAAVEEALRDAAPLRDELEESSLRIVPLVVSDDNEAASVSTAPRGWRYVPFVQGDWRRWYDEECKIIGKRLNKDRDVAVIIIRLDGKVGARSVGKPVWSRLVEEVRRLPPKDQYGKP